METVEIVLILVGVAFLVGSHFIQERFSEKDLQEISKMSETQLNIIVEKQLKSARTQVEDSVEEIIDESLEITKRGLEKQTNEKIMAISEYSDTIFETMNKTHNEIMFLYSMLNDKQSEMTDTVGTLQKYVKEAKTVQKEAVVMVSEAEPVVETYVKREPLTQAARLEEAPEEVFEDVFGNEIVGTQESMFINKNDQILMLHREGKSEVEIAKALDCGLGEVKLVLGLFTEEGTK